MIRLSGSTGYERAVLLIGTALVVATMVGIVLLAANVSPSGSGVGPLAVIVPVYVALTPVFIAAWRRRNKNDG